jgi:hypothetical protein
VQSRGLTRGFPSIGTSPSVGKLQFHRASQGVDFRALIRRRVRSRFPGVTPEPGRCSLDLFPLRGMQTRPLGSRPPFFRFRWRFVTFRCFFVHHNGSRYRSDRVWKRLRKVPPTSCGFFTSLPIESLSPPVIGRLRFSPVLLSLDLTYVFDDAALSISCRQATHPALMNHGSGSPSSSV